MASSCLSIGWAQDRRCPALPMEVEMSVGPHAGGRAHHISMDSVPPCVSADERASRFWSVAASKRRQALHLERRQRCYYDGLLRVSASRSDAAALRDRRQVEKDSGALGGGKRLLGCPLGDGISPTASPQSPSASLGGPWRERSGGVMCA